MIDAFLLGALNTDQATEFELRMQEDVQLALAVSARIESLAALEHAVHDICSEKVSPRSASKRETAKFPLLWLVATVSLVAGGTWLMWPESNATQQSIVANDGDSSVPAEQVIAQVADRWLAMIDEEGPIEVDPLDEFEFLPISMDDSWIGEIAAQTYRDSEA